MKVKIFASRSGDVVPFPKRGRNRRNTSQELYAYDTLTETFWDVFGTENVSTDLQGNLIKINLPRGKSVFYDLDTLKFSSGFEYDFGVRSNPSYPDRIRAVRKEFGHWL